MDFEISDLVTKSPFIEKCYGLVALKTVLWSLLWKDPRIVLGRFRKIEGDLTLQEY